MIDAMRENPIAPYRWRAEYRGGGRLKQFDVDGYHRSTEIEIERLECLVLEGHPAGELAVRVSGPIDEAFVMARNRLTLTPGSDRADPVRLLVRFGVRRGTAVYGYEVDREGRVRRLREQDE